MASYQQIDTRLEGVENALMWLMGQFLQVETVGGSPLDLQPTRRVISVLQHYREQMASGIAQAVVSEVKPEDIQALVDEVDNGVDGQ